MMSALTFQMFPEAFTGISRVPRVRILNRHARAELGILRFAQDITLTAATEVT